MVEKKSGGREESRRVFRLPGKRRRGDEERPEEPYKRERERNDRAGTNQRELQRVKEAGTRAKERAGLIHEREEMEVETRLGPLL